MSEVIAIPALLGSALWILLLIEALIRGRGHRSFLCDEPPEIEGEWPALTVVLAARDEAEHVSGSVGSLLEQDYPRLRIVAVDDRSEDGTAEQLALFAARDERLEVVTIRELPPGWLGKTHALQRGAGRSQAEWILFTDADVLFRPRALRRLVALAERRQADHVVIAPDDPAPAQRSVGERIFLAMFALLLILGREPWRLANPRSRSFLGIGAGNLVRRRAFEDIGGFEPIRLSVDDDIRLGQALKWSGWRQILASGRDAIAVRWQEGLGSFFRGLEKNAYAAAGFHLGALPLGLALLVVPCAGPHAGVWGGPLWLRVISGLGLMAAVGWFGLGYRSTRIRPGYALTLPIGWIFLTIAFLRSLWVTERQGGISWRGTRYGISKLREHLHERRAWMGARWRARRPSRDRAAVAGEGSGAYDAARSK